MWKIIKPILGVLLVVAALNGVRGGFFSEREVRSDMEAVGKITWLRENVTRVTRLAKKTDYYLQYAFVAHDGETYRKSFSITPEEFSSLREGQRVRVQYHSNNPSINAVPALRSYISVAEMQAMLPTKGGIGQATFLLITFLLGAYMIWSSIPGLPTPLSLIGAAREAKTPGNVASTPVPADRLATFGSRSR